MGDFPIGLRNGLITKEHKAKMGQALWYFAWLVDRVTAEYETPDGEVRGKVAGGAPIRAEDIDLGDTAATVRKHLHDLFIAGYIHKQQTRYGFRVEIRNSKKWVQRGFFCPDASAASDLEEPKTPDHQSSRVANSYNSADLAILKSGSPSIKDIAMGEDIAVPEDVIKIHPEETRERWNAALSELVAAQQIPSSAADVLGTCRVDLVGGELRVTRPARASPALLSKWAELLSPSVGQSGRLVWVDPNTPARAGPDG